MSTVTKDATAVKHISLTMTTGNIYEVLFYTAGQYRQYAYINNTGTGEILCGNTDDLVEGEDNVLLIPPMDKRLFVSVPMKGKLYLSGVSTCEIDFSEKTLPFNTAPASAFASAVAKGYTGTAEEFYTALAGIDDVSSVDDTLGMITARGTATDGLNGFIEDTTKTWQADQFAGKTIRLDIGGTLYYPVITSNTADTIYFAPMEAATGAIATLGSGEGDEGQIDLTLKGALIGSAGDDYSIDVVAGDTDTGTDSIALDVVNKIFTITVDTDGSGNPRALMAGNIAGAITANAEVAAVLEAEEATFTAGEIPVTAEPVNFAGGDDGIFVSAGDAYEIAYSTALENLDGQKISYSDIVNDDTTGGTTVPASAEIVKAHGTSISELTSIVSGKRYGVSGVGGSAAALTRLWDAVGLVAAVGTDAVNTAYYNSFDTLAPFNRRKCVGTWGAPVNGKSVFSVQSYYGDPDFAEDGTKGDYVAVEIDPLWYYQDLDAGIIGVSASYYPGWKPHPVCLDADGNIRDKTYLPCYNLAVKDGEAVSLPGYEPSSGGYKTLWDLARTYNSAAILEPMAVRHYEWLLSTIEFATQNAQSVMSGASNMAYSNTATYQATVATTGADGANKFILANAGADAYVVGQQLAMGDAAYAETYKRKILSIDVYDASNKALTFDGAALNIPVGYWSSSRPWYTGTCNTVKMPSGSPTSNSTGKYPARYRYRENVWGNIYSTCGDLFDVRDGDGSTIPYSISWYKLIDPTWYPANTSKPEAADLATASFAKLGVTTEYVDGYIKKIAADAKYPEAIVPVSQTGGSASTFFCDYGYFVSTTVIRSVRFGGTAYYGSYAGPLSFTAIYAPSYAAWYFGAGLFVTQ